MEQLQLDIRTDERVAVLTLDDPERRNALNAVMVAEITEVFDQLEADDDVGAVVITGAAPAFCAGRTSATSPRRRARASPTSTRASSGWPAPRCRPSPPSTVRPSGRA
jgi:enoyl-CoA hydratase/carnithine racemase